MKEKKNRRADKSAVPQKTGETAKPAPVTTETKEARWVNMMIIRAVREHATDIHVGQGPKGLTVSFRVDGALHSVPAPEMDLQPAVVSRLKKMARMKLEDERVPRDGRFGAIVDSREIDFRVHILPTSYGESMTLRLLDRATLIPMDKLGFSSAAMTSLRKMMEKPRGMILVAGPAGSGKTMTLYAMLAELAKSDKKVVTLEYPIEYDLPNVIQSQIDPRTGYDYTAALRVIARQDPDVVMVGGLEDADTAKAALQTVLGGHLVLSSIHANDAAEATARLLSMGIDPLLLGAGLEGIVEQRVLRRVCPSCKERVAPSKHEAGWLGLKPGQKLVKGRGCDECRNTGYKGRVGVFAVLPATEEFRDLVLTRPEPAALRRFYRTAEVGALYQESANKAKAGLTTLDEVLRVTPPWPSL